jgi:glycosyltransferase involved in cell wall biosynthesis
MSDVKVILLLMIKNESRIIQRAIASALPFADAICVSDTGSTDNTLEILDSYFPTLSVPAKYYKHIWTNFGINRTLSFQDAREFCASLGWNPATTFALAMDADMELKVDPRFEKRALDKRGYCLLQKTSSLQYINTRILRLDQPWRCVGATHEYWDGPNDGTPDSSLIWIDDKADGGCKADKYERDERLLLAELAEQPADARTTFYLAQTYMCLGQHEKAIDFYKKRIGLGGWWEEVWYSHYTIAKAYLQLKKPEKAELWVQRAQKVSNYRAEALYLLVHYYRNQPDAQWKAMHYYKEAKKIPKPAVALFLESQVYEYGLDYEYTILQFYVNPDRREGLRASIQYMLGPHGHYLLESVFSNLEFYVSPLIPSNTPPALLALRSTPLSLPPSVPPYHPSSTSLTIHKDKLVGNVRFVNYTTSRQGAYASRDADGIVRTRNVFVEDFLALPQTTDLSASPTFLDASGVPALPAYPAQVVGLEDIRLFVHNGALYYTAASKEHTHDNKVRVVFGEYPSLAKSVVLQPPQAAGLSDCEKNWLAVGDHPSSPAAPLFIYKWHPFQAGVVNPATHVLDITIEHETPPFFQKLRGSANPILIHDGKEEYLALVHVVKYGTPRKYYHLLVALDKATLKPMRVSLPFYFETHGIEYCIGFAMQPDDTLLFVYSTFDAEPRQFVAPMAMFTFLDL